MEPAVPVLLLHGFLGSPRDFDGFRERWESLGHEPTSFVTVDLVQCACATSETSQGRGDVGLDHLAREALTRIAPAQPQPRSIDVVGYSLGGRVLMALLASELGRCVRRAVMVSAHPGIESPSERAERQAQDDALAAVLEGLAKECDPLVRRNRAFAVLVGWYSQPLFASLRARADFEQVIERRAGGLADPRTAAAWSRILRGCSPGRAQSQWGALAQHSSRLLALVGAKDARYLATVDRLRALGLSVEVIPEAGHAIHLEATDSLVESVHRALHSEAVTAP